MLQIKKIGFLVKGERNQLITVRNYVPPELATIIVQLHVLTGCDATSGFFGRGKKVIMRNVMQSLETANVYLKDFGKN